jgi:hypothetical protein
MLRWLKRWIAYLLIPAGLVLLLIPLHTHRSEMTDRDFAFLEISETLAEAEEAATAEKSPPSEDRSMDALMQQLKQHQNAFSEGNSAPTTRNPYGYPVIELQDLTRFPALQDQVQDMMRTLGLAQKKVFRSTRLDGVSMDQWAGFKEAFLGDSEEVVFQCGNRIFRGHIESDLVSARVEVENLKMGCRVTGGVFLFLSLFMLHGMYAKPAHGIQIGKALGMILWDVVTLGIGIMFTWWFLDFILVKYFQTEPAWGDEMSGPMGLFWVVFVNPVMALIATATAAQTLRITRKDITLKGLFGQSVVAWSDVENIQLSEIMAPRRVGGIFAPRSVTQMLEISGNGASLHILEPPLPSTKKEILNSLAEHAPQALKDTVTHVSKEWISPW